MNDGFHQGTFLKFILKQLKSKEVEYQEGSKSRANLMLNISFSESTKNTTLQKIIEKNKIAFTAEEKVPKFLPVYVDRPRTKNSKGKKVYSKASIDPTTPLKIPVLINGKRGLATDKSPKAKLTS